jgi:hypothetical protein
MQGARVCVCVCMILGNRYVVGRNKSGGAKLKLGGSADDGTRYLREPLGELLMIPTQRPQSTEQGSPT